MYQIIDNKTGKVLSEHLSLHTATIKRNAQCFVAQDFDRFEIRYVRFSLPWENRNV